LLVQGQIQQRQFHQETAERLWAKAARLHPNDPDAQVAAAVGRFDMDDLSASFSRLGPLVKRFPKSQTVRFHLGLLLAWTGQRDLAVKEFRAARALGPGTRFGRESATFLAGLTSTGTGGSKR
jgi:predicted Zn-dependent protease